MILVHISDSHISLEAGSARERSADLERTVDAINALAPQPDAVVHTGDLVNRGRPEEYAQAHRALGRLRAPLYVVPGNRDDRDGLRDAFAVPELLAPDEPFVQFAVEDHPVRLLGLDTKDDCSQIGRYCDARHGALVTALARRPKRPTVVLLHHPPFDIEGASEERRFQFQSRSEAARLVDTLARDGNVIRVLCGHAHRDREVSLHGIPASTVTSLAVDLRPDDGPGTASSLPRFHVHRYREGDGFVTSTVHVSA